jgi:hypothetical protein
MTFIGTIYGGDEVKVLVTDLNAFLQADCSERIFASICQNDEWSTITVKKADINFTHVEL